MEGSAVWNTLDFILNALVFLVLGLQLPAILAEIRGQSLTHLIAAGACFSAIVVALRMLWVLPSAWAVSHWPANPLKFSAKSAFLVGWAGMRGVLALAAAFSLPERLPERSMILYLTFCVIFTTLVPQGLSMPFLIRRLGLAGLSSSDEEEIWARRQVLEKALAKLAILRGESDGLQLEALERLEEYYRRRLLCWIRAARVYTKPVCTAAPRRSCAMWSGRRQTCCGRRTRFTTRFCGDWRESWI
jgi:CPA1 family monovalent cation:H+ antiporter